MTTERTINACLGYGIIMSFAFLVVTGLVLFSMYVLVMVLP
jgi:hypothetical protein